MGKVDKRTDDLLELLQTRKRMDVREVASELAVSEATARRLFGRAEQQGKVIRVHGGVQLLSRRDVDYSYGALLTHRSRQKILVGSAAAELVQTNDRIFLDSGTTVLRFAEALAARMETGQIGDVTVLTNGITLVDVLAPFCRVILLGGEVRTERRDVHGVVFEKTIGLFRVNKAFLGVDGIDLERGLLATDERTSRMNEMVIARSDATFILADSEKFDRTSFVSYGPLRAVDAIYTDPDIAPEVLERYAAAGVRVVVARDEARRRSP
jgi:DeoR family transcriptional regulator, fructose operon transcriptional repressor